MARPSIPKLALLAIPGSLFWLLAGLGLAWEDDRLLGAAVVLAVVSIVTALAIQGMRSSRDDAERARLWKEGVPARALILSIRTRGRFNDHPRVEFGLQVFPTQGEPYPLTHTQLISELAIPRIQPELEIAVKLDPKDRTKLVVDEALTPYGYG